MTGSLLPRETDGDKAVQGDIIESLLACLKKPFLEEARGEMRKKWIKDLHDFDSAASCLTNPLPTIAKAFDIILEDNRLYGAPGAILSANVAEASGNGKEIFHLTFIAATADDSEAVGKSLSWTDADAVAFSAVTEGLPIHVASIAKHQHVKLFRPVNITAVQ